MKGWVFDGHQTGEWYSADHLPHLITDPVRVA